MNSSLKTLIFIASVGLCFLVTNVHSMKARIIGGRNATENEIKYIVSLRCASFFCGGGIIEDKFIITAAHCIHLNETTGKLLQPIKIAAATNTRTNYDNNSTIVIDVVRAFLPAVFNHRRINDIAILELKESLELKKNKNILQKLHLPKPSKFNTTLYPTYDNVNFKFAGYGRSKVDIVTDTNGTIHYQLLAGGRLKVANATVIDRNTCQKSWKFNVSDKHICISITEHEKKKVPQGTCRGDSGSPAVISNNVIVGIDSVGNKQCNNNLKPSVFTRISSYMPFIKNVIEGKTNGMTVYTL